MWKKGSKVIIVTGGEPSGIGSEIIVKTLNKFNNPVRIIVIGEGKAFLPFTNKINFIEDINEYKEDFINLIDLKLCSNISFGKPSPETSFSSIKALELAVSFIRKNETAALVTAPIYKAGIKNIKGYENFSGHTEYLAEAFGSDVLMMFYGKKIKVSTLTTHIPLRMVPYVISAEDIEKKVIIAYKSLKRFFKISKPRIAVTGLNPHSGEEGKIGDEEIKIIIPALEKLRKKRVPVVGPLSADTAFHMALKGDYSLIFGLYHDQVLGFFKALYFHTGVNVTLGLPFIRTSPDHGTAFQIAGKGIANEKSFENALALAVNLLYQREV